MFSLAEGRDERLRRDNGIANALAKWLGHLCFCVRDPSVCDPSVCDLGACLLTSKRQQQNLTNTKNEIWNERCRSCIILGDTLAKEKHGNVKGRNLRTVHCKCFFAIQYNLSSTQKCKNSRRYFSDGDGDQHRFHLTTKGSLGKMSSQPAKVVTEIEDLIQARLQKQNCQEQRGEEL